MKLERMPDVQTVSASSTSVTEYVESRLKTGSHSIQPVILITEKFFLLFSFHRSRKSGMLCLRCFVCSWRHGLCPGSTWRMRCASRNRRQPPCHQLPIWCKVLLPEKLVILPASRARHLVPRRKGPRLWQGGYGQSLGQWQKWHVGQQRFGRP